MWIGVKNLFRSEESVASNNYDSYVSFYAPEYYVNVRVTNDIASVYRDYDISSTIEADVNSTNCNLEYDDSL